jgi:hypothetical protein
MSLRPQQTQPVSPTGDDRDDRDTYDLDELDDEPTAADVGISLKVCMSCLVTDRYRPVSTESPER